MRGSMPARRSRLPTRAREQPVVWAHTKMKHMIDKELGHPVHTSFTSEHDDDATRQATHMTISEGLNMKLAANVARAGAFDWRSPGEAGGIGDDGPSLGLNADGLELEDYAFDLPPVGAGAEAIEHKLELRRRRLNQASQSFVSRTTATQLTIGSSFEVVDHPDGDLNGEYLVTSVTHQTCLDESRPEESRLSGRRRRTRSSTRAARWSIRSWRTPASQLR